MLYDVTSEDPPRLTVIEAVRDGHVAALNSIRGLRQRMQKAKTRYPKISNRDPIVREDGRTEYFLPPVLLTEIHNEIDGLCAELVERLHRATSMAEQESLMLHTVNALLDGAVFKGIHPDVFQASLESIEMIVQLMKRKPNNDRAVTILCQHVQRTIDNARDSYDCMIDLTFNYQRAKGIPDKNLALTPYDMALQEFENKGLSEIDMGAVQVRGLQLFGEIISPVRDALPDEFIVGMLGLVKRTTEAVTRGMLSDGNTLNNGQALRIDAIRNRSKQLLRPVLDKFPQASSDLQVLLNASSALDNALLPLNGRSR